VQIREELRIGCPADQVWAALIDPDVVFACMPGVHGVSGSGGRYEASVDVEAGPGRLQLEGSIEVSAVSRRRATALVRADDRRGKGRIRGTIGVEVEDRGLFSMVLVTADLSTGGSLADAGRSGFLTEAANSVAVAFAECIEGRLGTPAAGVAASVERAEGEPGDRPGLLGRLIGRLRRRG
jgi:carbon monoxide dehydrogenase subunit G